MSEKEISAAVRKAGSWSELERLCEILESGYRAGVLEAAAVEELAERILKAARRLPEAGLDVEEALWLDGPRDSLRLSSSEDGCPCCGGSTWWDKKGKRICAICHPPPGSGLRHRRAA